MEKTGKKTKKKKKSNISTFLIIGMMVVGLGIMLYPTISNYYNELTGSYAIQEFNENLANQGNSALEKQRKMAEAYNETKRNQGDEVMECEYEYEDIMDFGNGMMGYIEIPIIDVYLPIYHGITENVLSKGVGHIPRTAFPIGGEGNHSVLTGHTGSPSAHLFTDLIDLVEGNRFFVHILGETLVYEVDQILKVLPEEVDDVMPIAGMDYCTLVTCTPYGVNSHRLLVRGHRVIIEEEAETDIPTDVVVEEEPVPMGILIGASAAGGLGVVALLAVLVNRKKKMKKNAVNVENTNEDVHVAEESVKDTSVDKK